MKASWASHAPRTKKGGMRRPYTHVEKLLGGCLVPFGPSGTHFEGGAPPQKNEGVDSDFQAFWTDLRVVFSQDCFEGFCSPVKASMLSLAAIGGLRGSIRLYTFDNT